MDYIGFASSRELDLGSRVQTPLTRMTVTSVSLESTRNGACVLCNACYSRELVALRGRLVLIKAFPCSTAANLCRNFVDAFAAENNVPIAVWPNNLRPMKPLIPKLP